MQGRISTQMLKGVIAGCVLAVIARGETYGYEISQQLNGFGDIAEGTIYPVLLRLEKSGYITARYRVSQLGPKRKYYTITDRGAVELTDFRKEFGVLAAAVGNLLARDGYGEDGIANPETDKSNQSDQSGKGATS